MEPPGSDSLHGPRISFRKTVNYEPTAGAESSERRPNKAGHQPGTIANYRPWTTEDAPSRVDAPIGLRATGTARTAGGGLMPTGGESTRLAAVGLVREQQHEQG